MAKCLECGELLKYANEVLENKGICNQCGPGSLKYQEKHGIAVPAQEGPKKTRPDVIISHPTGGIEKFTYDKDKGGALRAIPLVSPHVGAQEDFVESLASEPPADITPVPVPLEKAVRQAITEGEAEDNIYENARVLVDQLRDEIATLRAENKALRDLGDNDATQDLTPEPKKKGKANAKRSQNDSKRRSKKGRTKTRGSRKTG